MSNSYIYTSHTHLNYYKIPKDALTSNNGGSIGSLVDHDPNNFKNLMYICMYICISFQIQLQKTKLQSTPPTSYFIFYHPCLPFLSLVCDCIVYIKYSMNCLSWQALTVFNITQHFHVTTNDKPLHIIVVVDIGWHKVSTYFGMNLHVPIRCSRKLSNEFFLVKIMIPLFENYNSADAYKFKV